MRKYKIIMYKNGFSIWKLKNFGGGLAWEDTGKRFETVEAAKQFIDENKMKSEVKKDESD